LADFAITSRTCKTLRAFQASIMQQDRAILFADIEGSVQLFRRLGDEQALALVEECQKMTRHAITQRQGIVVKLIGDGLMASFPDAGAACEAAILSQQGMAQLAKLPAGANLKLRVGIHAGPVIEVSGDYFGDTVNIAARLSAVANGGEIIIGSEMIASLPAHITPMLRRLGAVSLKGVGENFSVTEILWSRDAAMTLLPHDILKETVAPSRARLDLAMGGRRWTSTASEPRITLGRNDEGTFVLADPRASRDHATIQLSGEQWVLTDHSTNGTFVAFADEGSLSLRRKDLVLHGIGAIGFGFDPSKEPAEALRFTIFSTG
jgi:adenylate cyclase